MRRRLLGQKDKTLFEKRFFPAGNYTWIVPPGCTEVDVFLVGGGASGSAAGGGGGYTKTYKKNLTGWRDGNFVPVAPGQSISVIVGAGGAGVNQGEWNNPGLPGGYSQFLNSSYRANGGNPGNISNAGSGGSAGAFAWDQETAPNVGSDGSSSTGQRGKSAPGQGHTTRDFGDATGKRNAGGGGGDTGGPSNPGGISDYATGSGGRSNISTGGGGYGGGGAGSRYANQVSGKGGDGTVLIRYWAYSET